MADEDACLSAVNTICCLIVQRIQFHHLTVTGSPSLTRAVRTFFDHSRSYVQGWTGSGTCQVGRLVRRPGGPPRQVLKERVERRMGPRGPYLGKGGSA